MSSTRFRLADWFARFDLESMSKICMNDSCLTRTTLQWKKGWSLKSGGFAVLCHTCGSAYENSFYCETFHLDESGWRECRMCRKPIHCGCIASMNLHECMDIGGVMCTDCCKKALETHSVRPTQIQNHDLAIGFGPITANSNGDRQSFYLKNRMDGISLDKGKFLQLSKTVDVRELGGISFDKGSPMPFSKTLDAKELGAIGLNKGKLVQLSKTMDARVLSHCSQTQRSDTSTSTVIQHQKIMLPIREVGSSFSGFMQQPVGSPIFSITENSRQMLGVKDIYESLAQTSLSFSLSPTLDAPRSLLPPAGRAVEGREQNMIPPFQHEQGNFFLKPPKTALSIGSEADKAMDSQIRVARPPVEGRGRGQLLPRYWPRISDQELQQISGNLKSTIVPLFEKVLSASDAGRIGRLVLPKACAEAYFPPISQSDGLPLNIQDTGGNEWTFQFRFWPNNNSRMYVLEGVTPCIQNMQLQAGDTVIFSRLDPGGKLVMGFRKAMNPIDIQEQDNQISTLPNVAALGETSLGGANDNTPAHDGRTNEDTLQRQMLIPEKKRSRNISSKSKRLLMHREDAFELRLTWEEAQELLRPPPSSKPNIFMIEGREIEEYNEPPVVGKLTVFTARASGLLLFREQEQWAQCDSCSKWRRLPVDVLLPPTWTCSDNIWDLSRCKCSAPDEMNPMELESLLRVGRDHKKRKITESPEVAQECEPSGLDALATAAILGDSAGESGEQSPGTTTKHPRHRPGCTCIVCIQPPSGKGKHKSTCVCSVCLTARGPFKTFMMRKRQHPECEAEIEPGTDQLHHTDESEMDGTPGQALLNISPLEDKTSQNEVRRDVAESGKGQLDLNSHPNQDEDSMQEVTGGWSPRSFGDMSRFSMEMNLGRGGLTNASSSLLLQGAEEGENEGKGCAPDEERLPSSVSGHGNGNGNGNEAR
ncbi:B3 domain-containing transcription repressor VAL1-like isoform X2 [Diospyros lotus]|uniref:B3 domain-containing transcription repressor VAL1-like isoform X2 n=1 Tax=Diospyros lotus TaxID=55363 RepID=UPI00224CF997|nr:B3 domain-containing transcription repressor VAL1-like isoform X2 [Diospyros lotus]